MQSPKSVGPVKKIGEKIKCVVTQEETYADIVKRNNDAFNQFTFLLAEQELLLERLKAKSSGKGVL